MDLHGRVGEAVRLHGEGNFAAAEAIYREVLARHPDEIGVLTSLGNSLKAQGRFDEAVKAHLAALERAPGFVEGWSNLGLTYQAAGRYDEAVMALEQAVARRQHDAPLLHNLGNACLLRGDFARAAELCRRALAADPRLIPACITLASAEKELGRNHEAIAVLGAALALARDNPDLHWNLGLSLLLAGRLDEGWREIEWRRHIPALAAGYRQPAGARLWEGEPLAGAELALVAEQGLGDAIQFVRYAALARARGAGRVRVVAPGKLTRLLRGADGVDEVVPPSGAPAGRFAPFFSLPRLLGPDGGGVIAPERYLVAEPALVEQWGRALGPARGLRVGLGWQGNPQYRADRWRSIPLARMEAILRVPGVELVSLQKSPGTEQLARLPPAIAPVDLGARLDLGPDAFVDTAAVLAHLDLVITSDTSLPHLAGALGREVWLLLPAVPDWRWGEAGETSTWYPRTRLFRQRRPGDWDEVVARVATELAARAEKGPP